MYLIPAEIHTKLIIRFTVTSQFTTADDILKDWSIISRTASALLAETQAPTKAEQLKSGEDEVIEDNQAPDTGPDEGKDAASVQDTANVELWIDKAWNRPRRPMRSLSCSSEPLPYTYIGLLSSCEPRPSVNDPAAVLPTQATTGPGATFKVADGPTSLLGKQVLKKLTKFYSVPSFCNQWVQCGRHQLCGPMKVSQAAQKHLSSTCRRMNCMSSPPVANTAASPPGEAVTAPTRL